MNDSIAFLFGLFWLLLVTGLLAATKYRLTLALLILLQLVPVSLGLVLLAQTGQYSWSPVWGYAASIVALSVGFLSRSAHPQQRPHKTEPCDAQADQQLGWVIACLCAIGCLLHFARGGIPLFSSQIEVARYDFTSSGLLGIPGRIYLFGVPFAFVFAFAANRLALRRIRADRLLVFTFVLFAGSRILSGFKGGLVDVVLVTLISVTVLVSQERLQLRRVLPGILSVLVPVAAFAAAVGSTYGTYAQSGLSLQENLWRRLTMVAAEPAAYVLDARQFSRLINPYANDFKYFALRYTGQSTGELFAYDRAISSGLLGFSPRTGSFAPPVTIGGYAELSVALGVPIALAVMFLFGRLLRVGQDTLYQSALPASLVIAFSWQLTRFILNGSLAYSLINWMATLAFLLIPSLGLYWLHSRFIAQEAWRRGKAVAGASIEDGRPIAKAEGRGDG